MVEAEANYYHYIPTLAPAAIVLALFAMTTVLHLYQLVQTQTWFFLPLLVGGLFEVAGYASRIVNATEVPYHWDLPAYILQALLPLLAPALFAASIYIELGRIISLVDGWKHSLIKQKTLAPLFVLGDILSFLIQSSGAGLLTKKKPDAAKAGSYIIIGALVIQLIFFGFFVVVSSVFHRRLSRWPTICSDMPSNQVPWRKHMMVLYLTSTLILARSIYRMAVYAQGPQTNGLNSEVWGYCFDAALMLVVMISFNIVHPSEVTALTRGGRAIYKVVLTRKVVSLSNRMGSQLTKDVV